MVDSTPSDYHLTYLRERWERDRTSRVFLQLAEEYRRRGLHTEALEVLEVGLQHHPGYLAAQVSLGRCRMEAGQLPQAAEVLEGVLRHDPTQAVAIRLLAETWLRLRDPRRAREAIDRCGLLGVPPSELGVFEQRLRALREEEAPAAEPEEPLAADLSAGVGAAEPAAAGSWNLPEPSPPATPEPTESPGAAAREWPSAGAPVEPTVAPAAADLGWREAAEEAPSEAPAQALQQPTGPFGDVFPLHRLAPPPVALPARPPRDSARRLVRLGGDEPFALAGVHPTASASSDDVFALAAPAAAVAEMAPPAFADLDTTAAAWEPSPAVEPAPAPWHEPAPEAGTWQEPTAPASEEEPAPPVWQEPAAPAWEEPAPAAAAEPEPAAAVEEWAVPAPEAPALETPEHGAPAHPDVVAAEPEPTPFQPPPVAAPAPQPPFSGAPEPWSGDVEVQPSGSLAAAELRPSEPGTATLGELYLRQGYLAEAERIFRQVLARDPENEAALKGLETIGGRRGAALSASELLTGDSPEVRGVSARKILLLERYLQTLRRGARHDVPGTPE